MKLFLIRHGDYNDIDLDPEKGLSERGIKQSQKIAQFFKSQNIQPTEIWHSDKKRAIQTAEIIGEELTSPTNQKQHLAPMDFIKNIYDEIELFTQDLMIVGHLPFLNNLSSFLLFGHESPEYIDFPTAGVLGLTKPENDWKINWLISPNLINNDSSSQSS